MTFAAALLFQAAASPAQPCPAERVARERIYDGVYIDEFEGQRFVAGARTLADVSRRERSFVWLSFDVAGEGARFGITKRAYNGAYRIRFRGVERTRGSDRLECGYGHLGIAQAEATLVQLLGIEPLAAPGKP